METNINNEALELARQLREYTQKDVAEKLGISQGQLSKAEHGLQELPQEVIQSLAELYDLPIEFFYSPKEQSPVSHYYFRRKISLSAKILDRFIAQVQVFKMMVDEIMKPVEIPAFTLQCYSTENNSPIEIANMTRYALGIYHGAVPNLVTLLENNGIIIHKFDFGTDKLDALSTCSASGKHIIFLNNKMPNDRLRFTLAHELGHIIMHLDKIPQTPERVEEEANEFASQFLMPDNEIQSSLYQLNFETLTQLKRYWKVSIKALLYRAKTLETITDKMYRYMQITYSKKGYNKQEPYPLPPETPSLIDNTLFLYKEELNYTDNDLMAIMKIGHTDYKKFFLDPKFRNVIFFNPTR